MGTLGDDRKRLSASRLKWIGGLGAGAIAALFLASRAQFEIVHSVDIDAPVEDVWAAVVDFPSYKEWNSQLSYLGGDLRAGGKLHLRLSVEGGPSYEFHPVISSFDPPRRFAWLARTGVPRVFDGEHFFEVSPSPSGGTRLTNREEYRGVLSLVMRHLPMMKLAPAGFEKMDLELKAYVEKKVAARRARD